MANPAVVPGRSFEPHFDPRELPSEAEIERRVRIYPDEERRAWLRRKRRRLEWRRRKSLNG